MPEAVSYDQSREMLKAKVLAATQAAHALPAPGDMDFHRTLHRQFSTDLDAASSHLLSLTSNLLHLVNDKTGELQEETILDEHSFDAKVVETVDGLLELVDGFVEEHKYGKNKSAVTQQLEGSQQHQQSPQANQQQTAQPPVASSSKAKLDSNLVYAKNLAKPQLSFAPAQKPSNRRAERFQVSQQFPNVPIGSHPFADALQTIPETFPVLLDTLASTMANPTPPASFEDTPFSLVDSVSSLEQLFQDFDGVTELAIDLEHHDFRTYAGFTCLMQLSTPIKDYIIDVLQPQVRARLYKLNKWTADPAIVKVFHGAKSDVMWLQRDFGIFLVGLFDTFFASKLLEYPHHGLANLLDRFCNFTADKRYQLADWRIRPLPQDMLFYARSDTHFLLYIFHSLLAAVKSSQPDSLQAFKKIAEQSNEVAGGIYEHPVYDPSTGLGAIGWRGLVQKFNKHLAYFVPAYPHEYTLPEPPRKTTLEFHVFRALHDWRDRVARENDESPRYILSHHLLFKLAEERPDSMTKLRILLGPQVKGKEELIRVIKKAVDRWEELPEHSQAAAAIAQDADSAGKLGNGMVIDDLPVQPAEALWSENSAQPSMASPGSTTFKAAAGHALASTSSTLLGVGFSAPSSASSKNKKSSQRQMTVERYQRALQKVMNAVSSAIPAAPTPSSVQNKNPKKEETEKATFIPLEDRKSAHRPLGATQIPPEQSQQQTSTTSSAPPQEDTDMDLSQDVIVVSEHNKNQKSGTKKAKKRSLSESTAATSAEPNTGTTAAAEPSGKKAKKGKSVKKERPEVAPFDYSQEPSVLDAAPSVSSSARPDKSQKKKDKKQQREGDKGPKTFKAPPRDRLNVSSGGKSQTFRS